MKQEFELRVELEGAEFFWYLFPAITLAMCSAVYAWLAVGAFFEQGALNRHELPLFLLMFAAFALLAFFVQWKLRRDLRFRRIETELTADQSYARVLRMVERYGWKLGYHRPNALLIYHTRSSWFSWGERVCVKFRDRTIWVSSICDPDRLWAVFGRHARNFEDVERSVA